MISALLITIGCLRIASTYSVFTQAWDEPGQIAAGMEWLDEGEYTLAPGTPPLARVSGALGPYLSGLRLPEVPDGESQTYPKWVIWRGTELAPVYHTGNEILHAGGAYTRNLALARLGILPLFIVSSLLVWSWSRELFGNGGALVALALYTGLPPILAHSGLATADMALAWTLFLALFFFMRWLRHPTLRAAVWLGLGLASAFLSKMTALAFIPASFLVIFVAFLVTRRRAGIRERWITRRVAGSAVLVSAVCMLAVWFGYRFSHGRVLDPEDRPHEGVDTVLPAGSAANSVAYWILEADVPAPEFLTALKILRFKNSEGRWSYLMGELRQTGWWYFFLVAILVKTPIPFLLLSLAGIGLATHGYVRANRFEPLPLLLTVVSILVIAASGRVTIGVRHVLAVYPMLAMLAGYAIVRMWNARSWRRPLRVSIVCLSAWYLAGSAMAHPDYLAYFNEIASDRADEFLAESDLDWGQDVGRLAGALSELGADSVWVALNGSAFLDRLLPAEVTYLERDLRPSGWIAVSSWRRRYGALGTEPNDAYAWLEQYTPVREVGKSIRLFRVGEGERVP